MGGLAGFVGCGGEDAAAGVVLGPGCDGGLDVVLGSHGGWAFLVGGLALEIGSQSARSFMAWRRSWRSGKMWASGSCRCSATSSPSMRTSNLPWTLGMRVKELMRSPMRLRVSPAIQAARRAWPQSWQYSISMACFLGLGMVRLLWGGFVKRSFGFGFLSIVG